MRKLKAIIIDDEPTAIEGLKELLQDNEKISIVETFTDSIKALESDLANNVDLIFLDINMPKINGIDFAKNIKTKAEIIFTTGERGYALEGYELGAISYLLKPIKTIKLIESINRVFKLVFPEVSDTSNSEKVKSSQTNGTIVIDEGAYRNIFTYSEILYAKANEGRVTLRVIDRKIEVNKSLTSLLSELPNTIFVRTHNNSFVNKNFVSKVDRNRIYLKGCKDLDDVLDLSRNQEKKFWEKIYGQTI